MGTFHCIIAETANKHTEGNDMDIITTFENYNEETGELTIHIIPSSCPNCGAKISTEGSYPECDNGHTTHSSDPEDWA